MSALTPSRIAAEVEFFTEREQAARDAAADAEYEREQAIERAVTFDDLLEELQDSAVWIGAAFMIQLVRGNPNDRHSIYCMLTEAKQRIIKRRMAQEK